MIPLRPPQLSFDDYFELLEHAHGCHLSFRSAIDHDGAKFLQLVCDRHLTVLVSWKRPSSGAKIMEIKEEGE